MLTYELLRGLYVLLSLYSLWVLVTRWRVVKVMTEERRWLFLFLVTTSIAAVFSGVIKIITGAPGDASVYLTVLSQALLGAYLHTFIPRERRSRWSTPSWRTTPTSRSS